MVRRIFLAQLLATLAATAAGALHGSHGAYSAFLGGLICLVPNAYFAWRVFGRASEGTPDRVFGGMLRAEVAKLALAGVMFAVVFATVQGLNVLALFVAYMAVHVAGALAAGAGSARDTRTK